VRNNIYKIVLLSLGLVLCAVALFVYRPVQNRLTRITVVGDSEAKIAPDTAVVRFSVVTEGKDALSAQQENARKSEAVKASVEQVAASSKIEFKTSDYNLSPEEDYSGKVPKIAGYEVRNTVSVSLSDMNQVGAVIDAATRAGANSVDGISFVVGEASPAQGDALSLATKQALAKAESIAKSLNGRIVRVVETNEGGVPLQTKINQDGYNFANSNATANLATTPIQAGSLNVRSQVVLVVEVEI
jgi:uncharacterized protein